MAKGMNALDWYTDEHCSRCDVPGQECRPGSPRQIACLLAAILHEMIAQER